MDLVKAVATEATENTALQPFSKLSSGLGEVAVNLVGRETILVNPNQQTAVYDSMDLIELARQVQTADNFTRANATSKLTMIVEQIRFLQEQARKVLEEAATDRFLHHVPCNFKKIPGRVYFLYERSVTASDSGSVSGERRLFSMLAPQEWGKPCPYKYLGAYKLQYDMSWTPEEKMVEKEQDLMLINRFLEASSKPARECDPFAFSITEIPDSSGSRKALQG